MASSTITHNHKLDGLFSKLMSTNQSITISDPGVYLVIIKFFNDTGFTRGGIYIVTISAGSNEYSKVVVKEGTTPPSLAVSSSGMTFSVGSYGSQVEFSYINFIDFRL